MKERLLLLIASIFIGTIKLFAQVPPPPNFEEHGPGPGYQDTPINEFSILLALVGICIGAAYYIYSRKKLA